ncbi:MAG TPA: DciA family protein [Microbacteriaceae bacterium]|nr:DciA family protein [Microbacteriaceae bacterium]
MKAEDGDECLRFYLHMKDLMHGSAHRSRPSGRVRRASVGAATEPFSAGRDPRGLGEALDQLSVDLGWESSLAEAALLAGWRDLVGEETAAHTEPVSIERGVLAVRCTSTAWATQLRLLRQDLLNRIDQRFPRAGIEMIRFEGPDVPSWKRGLRAVPGRGPRDTYG